MDTALEIVRSLTTHAGDRGSEAGFVVRTTTLIPFQMALKNRDAVIKEFMAGNGKFTHDEIVGRNRAVTVMT